MYEDEDEDGDGDGEGAGAGEGDGDGDEHMSRKGRRNDDILPVRSFLTLVSVSLEKSDVAHELG